LGRDRGNLMKSNRTEASKDPVSSNIYVRLQNCWNVMEEDQTDAGVADHDMIGCGAEVRLHLPSLSELAAKRHKSTHYIRAHKKHVVMACKKTKCHSKQKKSYSEERIKMYIESYILPAVLSWLRGQASVLPSSAMASSGHSTSHQQRNH